MNLFSCDVDFYDTNLFPLDCFGGIWDFSTPNKWKIWIFFFSVWLRLFPTFNFFSFLEVAKRNSEETEANNTANNRH